MAFSRDDLERVWVEVYEPCLDSLGFDAVRIDQQDDGTVKIDQIVNEISVGADLIVGDLTYERPNCYFELGYARARRQDSEIILCCRRDHVDQSEYRSSMFEWEGSTLRINFRARFAPPRVHFDLAAFDVLTWDLGDLEGFRKRLEERVRQRLSLIRTSSPVPTATQPVAARPKEENKFDLKKLAAEMRRRLEEES